MNFYPWSCPLELQSRERSFRMAHLLQVDFFSKCHPVAASSHTSATSGRHGARVTGKEKHKERGGSSIVPGSKKFRRLVENE